MRSNKKILVGLAAAGLVATGGSAFTASNTVGGDNYAGYGSAAVTGAITEGIEHTLGTDGTTINSTLITFTTDLTAGHTVTAAFGTADLQSCTVTLNESPAKDTATCAYTPTFATATATDFKVAVS